MPSEDITWSSFISTKTKKIRKGGVGKSIVLSQTIHKRKMHDNTSHQNSSLYLRFSYIAGYSKRNVHGLRGSC